MKKAYLISAAILSIAVATISKTDFKSENKIKDDTEYVLPGESVVKFSRKTSLSDEVDFDKVEEIEGKHISNVKAQLLKNEDNTYNIRFVSAISVENYNSDSETIPYGRLGYVVDYFYNNQRFSYVRDLSVVYKAVIANGKTYSKENMSEFDATSDYSYFITYTLKNVPADAFDVLLNVRPFAYSSDMTKLYSSKGYKNTSINSVINNLSTFRVVSTFDSLETSPIQYVEPVHDRDKNNNIVADSSQIDTEKAKIGNTAKNEHFLENVSAYGKFKYTYESDRAHGKFDIYASVASNGTIGGDVSMIWPEAQGGFIGSQSIDFTKILTLKNNDTIYPINEGAIIPETHLTSEMDPATIGQGEQVKESAWSACTYFLLNNFKRIHLGTVDIVEGTNEIELDIGYLFGGFGYASSMCGNWKNIEIIYTDETTNNEITSIEMVKAPKLEYAIGETFSLDGAKFIGYNKDGVEVETIDNSKIEILDNSKLIADKTINLRYQNIDFSVDVKVSNTLVQELNTLDVDNMNIKYIEMSTDNHKAEVQGTYIDKVSKDSYFEYEIESDKERTITVYAEVATNAYLHKGDAGYEDYDTGIEGFTQNYIGSYDLDLSKSVKMTNSVNDNEPEEFKVNEDAIAYGHVINAKDDLEASKKYNLPNDQWGMADELCMRQFRNIKLGEVKLSAGKNVIRLTMQGYLQKNDFAFERYACGNWKSITLELN